MVSIMPKASHTPLSNKDYQELLRLLRENDECVTGIDMTECVERGVKVAKSLGEALVKHTSCTYLQVDLCKLLSVTTSHDNAEQQLVTQSFAPLLQYIRSSASLSDVALRATDTNTFGRPNDLIMETLLTQVARAISENACIDTLKCTVHGSYINMLPVNALTTRASSDVASSTHIRKFILVLRDEHLCTNQQQTMLAQALLANETLEILTLVSDGRGDTATCILNELQGRCPNLLYLTLMITQPQSMEHIQALERFIQAAAAPLRYLFLDGYHFTVAGSGNLFALIFDSPMDFSLSGCILNVEATDMFVRAIQQAKNCADPTHLLNVYADVEFENKSLGTVLATALAGSWRSGLRIAQRPSNNGGDVPAILLTNLFHGLVANHCNIRLSCLKLKALGAAGAAALAGFLPVSSTLSTLSVDTLENGVNQRQLFHAIRQNGSLLTVEIEALSSSLVNGPRLATILHRNSALPALTKSKGKLQALPAAFRATQEAPRMAPKTVLMGLAAADDETLGPSPRQGRGVKRDREE